MSRPSPYPSYIFGALGIGIGLLGLTNPVKMYENFGLPLDSAPAGKKTASGTHPAALSTTRSTALRMAQAKAARDLASGVVMVVLQSMGYDGAITLLCGANSLIALLDGAIVWRHGGDEFRGKAVGHWGGLVGFVGWVAWRTYHYGY